MFFFTFLCLFNNKKKIIYSFFASWCWCEKTEKRSMNLINVKYTLVRHIHTHTHTHFARHQSFAHTHFSHYNIFFLLFLYFSLTSSHQNLYVCDVCVCMFTSSFSFSYKRERNLSFWCHATRYILAYFARRYWYGIYFSLYTSCVCYMRTLITKSLVHHMK